MKELSEAQAAQSGCSVDTTEAHSVLPMTKMAATLGHIGGMVMDLATEDENGQKWDLSDLKTEKKNRGETEGGSSVVSISVRSLYHVRNDDVTELHKAQR